MEVPGTKKPTGTVEISVARCFSFGVRISRPSIMRAEGTPSI
ncbi:hypothetical protein M2459_001238 [Parabacteroides sp. PF5-5]|nr:MULTISPECIES: hypothetical protein [unclassified Parabacteroides]MDH6304505.1 hypothetical protein [Parabacteroides sp. PH5-39]MDH6322894.1 hypothetical protein [Parabacteroides sp. PH5-8]MDH6326534.1 hypothetical protein [Parabacteroides sp. PH5-41]MDH6334496.1 hypothetical protein [Parabacteroides sp. PF5-5]MDH6345399.1 hypothetical protein [Parabacteroides sp. PH5-46]